MGRFFKKTFRCLVLNPIEAIFMLLFWALLLILGRRKSCNLMGWIGRKYGRLLKRPTSVARRNLKAVFPEKSDTEIEGIISGVWENLGRTSAEYGFFTRIDINDPDFFEIAGQEHVQALIDDGKPGILVGGHLANWVMVSIATAQLGLPVTQIYRRFNNPIYDWMVDNAQKKSGIKSHWKGAHGGRDAYKSLKNGEHLVLFVDQKLKEGIPVPFFGREAMTAPAAARLALKLDCPIVPVQIERVDKIKFRITYHPPIDIEPSGNIHEDIQKVMISVNQLLETWIRKNPDQWLWVHNRWPKN